MPTPDADDLTNMIKANDKLLIGAQKNNLGTTESSRPADTPGGCRSPAPSWP